MHAIKDGVKDKLSRLFSDSPSSPTVDQESEARPCSKDGKSPSYIISSILPSINFDWFRTNAHSNETKSIKSNSFQWRSKSFSLKDKPLECDHENDNRETTNCQVQNGDTQKHKASNTHVEYADLGSARSFGGNSDVYEGASTPNNFENCRFMANLMDESRFISPDLYRFFEASLPNLVKGCQWVLLYSTLRHGISLRTLVRNTVGLSGSCLLITSDMKGAVFGGFLDCPLTPTAKRKYQGTTQSFVFTTIYGEPRLFRPTGANRYFYMCLNDMLAFGGGGHFALCLNEDLLTGSSGPCDTFGNSCLAHDDEFELKHVELWGFTHASQYLH